jgi:hypothetical protein
MTKEQTEKMQEISGSITECWTRIKAKARSEGHVTNIEKHAPCITAALNDMEQFLGEMKREDADTGFFYGING